MRRNDLVSDLVKKLEERPSVQTKKREDEITISSAIETLRATGQNVSVETARKTLEEVKRERYEASIPGRTKKYFERIVPKAKYLGRQALVIGSLVGVVSGLGYGAKSIYSSATRQPSDFVAGTVVEIHGSSKGDYTLKVDTPKGIYEVDFYRPRTPDGMENRRKLVEIIKKGALVNFPTKNLPKEGLEEGIFYGKFGVIHTKDISVTY